VRLTLEELTKTTNLTDVILFFFSLTHFSTEQEFLDLQQASNWRDIGCNHG